ncbi:Type II secretory pathway, component PulF [Thauera aromatica K172]|uniref:Type II secretory pathway, component PulF n=1 Tax=Thauera aromatica K172 TaxID=44139 RepID=A0A2R4BJZ0_THAAR|nr:Type II secretory pathway, component PulF [Thauera aromatica K172]
MSLYRYRALAADGRHVRGELEAGDLAELEHRLRPLGLVLINGEPRRRARRPTVRVPRRELIHFCFHLEQLLSAGIPPFDSLAALRDASPHPRTRAMVCALLAAVERGKPLSDAAAALPGAFSPVAVGLLRAGEAAGTLPQAVRDIGTALARDDELAAHARRIAIYPAIVGGILLLAVVVALTELVPELEKLARSTGQALPLQTRILVALSHAVRDWGWALLLAQPAPPAPLAGRWRARPRCAGARMRSSSPCRWSARSCASSPSPASPRSSPPCTAPGSTSSTPCAPPNRRSATASCAPDCARPGTVSNKDRRSRTPSPPPAYFPLW